MILSIFEYSINNPIEFIFEYYKILKKNTILYNYLIGDYLLFTVSKYIYIYLLHNFEELICYVILTCLYKYINFLFLHVLLRYQYLLDINGVDYYEKQYRFQLNYNLISMYQNSRIYIKILLTETIKVHSLNSIFNGACWYEREIWDFFGIAFIYNSDLRRLLTDYAFEGYPLKKDFPLSGFIEVRYNELIKRLSYIAIKSIQEFKILELQNPWEYIYKIKYIDLFNLYTNIQNMPLNIEYLINK